MKTKSIYKALLKKEVPFCASIFNRFEYATTGTHEMSWINQNSEALCLKVRRLSDKDDMQSDYHAGSFASTLRQALNWLGV